MRLTMRSWRGAAVAAVASLALTGCVSQSSSTSNSSSTASGSSTAGGSSSPGGGGTAKSTVTVWSWFNKPTMQKAIDEFQKENPGVKVDYTYYNYDPEFLTALKAAANSGTLPDVIGLQPGSLTQQYRSNLAPINDLAAQTWGANWEKDLFAVDAAQMRMGNPKGDTNSYILPQESQVLATWYNTKIFSDLKLSVPTTLDQLVNASQKIKAAGLQPMYQGAANAWQNENVFLILANQLKSGITDEAQAGKVKWTDPTLVQAMTTWGQLFKNGVFQAGALGAQAYPTGAQLFGAGKVGMFTIGSWFLQNPQLPDQPTLVQGLQGFDYFQFPAISATSKPGAVVGGIDIGLGLTKSGATNSNAWKFMADVVRGKAGQAALKDLNDLPVFKAVKLPAGFPPKVAALYDKFMAQLPSAVNQRFSSTAVKTALDDALSGVAAGSSSPTDALAKVQTAQDSGAS